jgi:putative NADH-flavin reductase
VTLIRLVGHGVTFHALDVALGREALTRLAQGVAAMLSAFNPGRDPDGAGVAAILGAARDAGVRLIVVGGAGSPLLESGERLVDSPDFPPAWKAGALRTAALLERLYAEPEGLDWTFLSPAAQLFKGERTGRYRVGGDGLLRDAAGESRISLADYALALLDEAERPVHRRQRFSVAW